MTKSLSYSILDTSVLATVEPALKVVKGKPNMKELDMSVFVPAGHVKLIEIHWSRWRALGVIE